LTLDRHTLPHPGIEPTTKFKSISLYATQMVHWKRTVEKIPIRRINNKMPNKSNSSAFFHCYIPGSIIQREHYRAYEVEELAPVTLLFIKVLFPFLPQGLSR